MELKRDVLNILCDYYFTWGSCLYYSEWV